MSVNSQRTRGQQAISQRTYVGDVEDPLKVKRADQSVEKSPSRDGSKYGSEQIRNKDSEKVAA